MANVIALVSSLIAAVALVFTAYQVRLLNRQARIERRVVLEGVAVSWRPIEQPSRADRPDGTATWVYELVLVNPGRLPIDDVQIRWTFPCDVVRLRHNGVLDRPARTLVMSAPVVVGGGDRVWRRHLLIDFGRKDDLVEVYAEVVFNDMEGERRTNRWPRLAREPVRRSARTAVGAGR